MNDVIWITIWFFSFSNFERKQCEQHLICVLELSNVLFSNLECFVCCSWAAQRSWFVRQFLTMNSCRTLTRFKSERLWTACTRSASTKAQSSLKRATLDPLSMYCRVGSHLQIYFRNLQCRIYKNFTLKQRIENRWLIIIRLTFLVIKILVLCW